MSFTGFAFYIAVRCSFDKHLYLKSCLNAHNHNTCLSQTGCTARKMALFIISQDRQTQVFAANAMGTIIIIYQIHDFHNHCQCHVPVKPYQFWPSMTCQTHSKLVTTGRTRVFT